MMLDRYAKEADPERLAGIEKGKKAAKRIERKYGKKNLILSDFEYGAPYGRMTAMAWVLGAEWDEAGDT